MSLPNVNVANTTVTSGVMDETGLQIAKDFLSGYTGEYFFFENSDTEYILLYNMVNPVITSSGCTADSAEALAIYKMVSDHRNQSTNYNLQAASTDPAVITGSSTYVETVYYYKMQNVLIASPISVRNTQDFVCYSSAAMYPHLIEGVENYAFAAFLFAFGVVVYRLADKLFRRVY